MKAHRIRGYIIDCLFTGYKNSTELVDCINLRSKHGTSIQQLGNILAKDKRFIKVGYTPKHSGTSGRYPICIWGLLIAAVNSRGKY